MPRVLPSAAGGAKEEQGAGEDGQEAVRAHLKEIMNLTREKKEMNFPLHAPQQEALIAAIQRAHSFSSCLLRLVT